MATKRLIVHWDSCIFFAWLNNEVEAHGPAVMDGIAEMVADIDSGKIVMITSVQTKTDVYDHKLKTQWARDEFAKMLQRPNVMQIIQDERVADKSREIREYYARKDVTLDATDCTQLASAILWGADVFYTLDGSGANPKRNDLLPLDGNIAGYPLPIKKPNAEQGSLFTGIPQKAVSAAVVLNPRTKARKKSK
jgi:PIN domain